jgi:heat shock protein HslJ
MIRFLRWSAMCAVLAAGCGGTASGPQLAGTRWTLDVSGLAVDDASSVSSWIAFERAHVSGNDGCNAFSGSYQADGSNLTFGPLAGTRKACDGPAEAVSRHVTTALGRVRTYEIAAGTLRMYDASGAAVLTYAAEAEGIEGSWTVISVLYDDAIRSVVADTEPTADFSADGKIGGSTGCNDFDGPYTLQGTKLDIGPLNATDKACPTKDASRQEAGYLAALESAVRIERAGPQLTLFNAKGQMAVTLARK